MLAMLRHVVEDEGTPEEVRYDALLIVCPGCKFLRTGATGVHLLPVNTDAKTPSWTWNGNLEKPTLDPSILSVTNDDTGEHAQCHSYLTDGKFQYLLDCNHPYAGQFIDMIEIPDWLAEHA